MPDDREESQSVVQLVDLPSSSSLPSSAAFLSSSYRFVFSLDVTPSSSWVVSFALPNINLECKCALTYHPIPNCQHPLRYSVTVDALVSALDRSLRALAEPYRVAGQLCRASIAISVLAQTDSEVLP